VIFEVTEAEGTVLFVFRTFRLIASV